MSYEQDDKGNKSRKPTPEEIEQDFFSGYTSYSQEGFNDDSEGFDNWPSLYEKKSKAGNPKSLSDFTSPKIPAKPTGKAKPDLQRKLPQKPVKPQKPINEVPVNRIENQTTQKNYPKKPQSYVRRVDATQVEKPSASKRPSLENPYVTNRPTNQPKSLQPPEKEINKTKPSLPEVPSRSNKNLADSSNHEVPMGKYLTGEFTRFKPDDLNREPNQNIKQTNHGGFVPHSSLAHGPNTIKPNEEYRSFKNPNVVNGKFPAQNATFREGSKKQFSISELDHEILPKKSDKKETSTFRSLFEWFIIIFIAVFCAFLIRTFGVQSFWIPSHSMENTLSVGDRILVSKISYSLSDVKRGDVVVFKNPDPNDQYRDLVKRVIGLPGETVEVVDGVVFINGTALDNETYLADFVVREGNYGPEVVPEDSYFMMGDNRNNSKDSRKIGFIKRDAIVGKVFLKFWPPSRMGRVE